MKKPREPCYGALGDGDGEFIFPEIWRHSISVNQYIHAHNTELHVFSVTEQAVHVSVR